MIIKTGRFGDLTFQKEDEILVPNGILGFPTDKRFCLVDLNDDTLILWMQSLDHPELVFPVLEPKIIRADYKVSLSGADHRELGLRSLSQAAVFSILTISGDITQMTANMKAPIVINLELQVAKQVVLQENEYNIKYPMFKELKKHLVTIDSQKRRVQEQAAGASAGGSKPQIAAVPLRTLSPSPNLVSLVNT